jgi:hypothetical protein
MKLHPGLCEIYTQFNELFFRTNQSCDQQVRQAKLFISGQESIPYIQDFNDANVLTNSGWTAYSVTN